MIELTKFQRTPRYEADRYQDHSTKIEFVTTNGARILILEDMFRGIDVLVYTAETDGDDTGHIYFSDEHHNGVKVYAQRLRSPQR